MHQHQQSSWKLHWKCLFQHLWLSPLVCFYSLSCWLSAPVGLDSSVGCTPPANGCVLGWSLQEDHGSGGMEYMNATKNDILNLVDFGSHPHGSHPHSSHPHSSHPHSSHPHSSHPHGSHPHSSHPHSSHPHGYRFSLLDTEIHGRTLAALWSVNKDRDNGYQRS